MGQSPTINIIVDTDFESAVEIAKELSSWIDGETMDKSIESDDYFEFKLDWKDSISKGEDANVQKLWISWVETGNEYKGVNSDEVMLVHYSSYYYEKNIERFTEKAIVMTDILEWLRNNTDAELNHFVSTSTT